MPHMPYVRSPPGSHPTKHIPCCAHTAHRPLRVIPFRCGRRRGLPQQTCVRQMCGAVHYNRCILCANIMTLGTINIIIIDVIINITCTGHCCCHWHTHTHTRMGWGARARIYYGQITCMRNCSEHSVEPVQTRGTRARAEYEITCECECTRSDRRGFSSAYYKIYVLYCMFFWYCNNVGGWGAERPTR